MSERYTQVTGELWRGPRPKPSEYWWIREAGFTVISLEGEAEDRKEAIEMASVKLISMPIVFKQIYFTGISQAYLNAILGCIKAAAKPVLVHCQHGQDRTGLVIAAYRVTQGWTKDKAMQEALHFGYRRWINFGLNRTWEAFQ